MNTEANKHLAWMLGLLGSITLRDWNQIAGIACATAGFIAACLSIYSWVEKRRRKARELRDHGTTDLGPRSKELKRKHHRRTLLWFLVILGLVLTWALIVEARTTETTGLRTTDYGTGTRSPVQAAALSGSRTAALSRDAATDVWVVQVADDVRKLVYDFLSGFSWAGFIQAVFVAYLGAKGLRNHTPLGNMKVIGDVLRWLNLEAQTGTAVETTAEPAGGTPALRTMSGQTNKTQ